MSFFDLHPIDVAVIGGYLLLTFAIGVYFSRRASRSTEEFFVSGRSLPWWIVGTSMVATTFAADTPLAVSGLVARGGIFRNWIWLYYGIGGICAAFLFADSEFARTASLRKHGEAVFAVYYECGPGQTPE